MRRHPLLFTFGCAFLVGVLVLAYQVATFDLNRYRDNLQTLLSDALGMPVHLGEARLGFRYGPTLDFSDIQIGDLKEQSGRLSASHAAFRLSIAELLQGKLTARGLLIEDPNLELYLDPPPRAPTPPPAPAAKIDPEVLHRLDLQSCSIRRGRLRVVDRRTPGTTQIWAMTNLDGRLTNLAPGRTANFQFNGLVEGKQRPVEARVIGEVAFAEHAPFWGNSRFRVTVKAPKLPAAWFQAALPLPAGWGLSGETAIVAEVDGIPMEGLTVAVTVAGPKLLFKSPARPARPLFKELRLTGRWFATEGGSRLAPLVLTIGGQTLTSSLDLHRSPDGKRQLTLSLEGGKFQLHSLLEFLPDSPGSPAGYLRTRLSGGQIFIDALRLKTSIPPPPASQLAAALTADLRLSKLGMNLPGVGPIEDMSCRLHVADKMATITDGRGRLGGENLDFGGTLNFGEAEPNLALSVNGHLDGARLQALLPASANDLTLQGSIPFRASLSGFPTTLRGDLRANLEGLKASFRDLWSKGAGQPGALLVSGQLLADRLTLEQGRIQIPPLDLKINGSFGWKEPHLFRLQLDLEPLNLQRGRLVFPFLEKLQASGALGAHFDLEGQNGEILHQNGTFTADKAGFFLGGVTADLADATGRIVINGRKAAFANLSARLGTSPVTLSGDFSDVTVPRGNLHLTSRSILASELVFTSDRTYLRDIDARLQLSPEGIVFAPVTTRLDGGTRAEVRGEVRNFRDPVISLTINSSYGNIDEVIKLWETPLKATSRLPAHPRRHPRLQIEVRTEAGSIGGMDFQSAEGTITLKDTLLVIHPLRCRIGPGYAVGQVLVDSGPGSPPLLRISGHVEDVDAAAVHQQLLRQKSLVNGSLRGDFYLQGRAGSDFLPTSMGGFSVEIRQGVLRKFKSLSKVFSLLNVSQILALKLPDMDREGMPFETVTGTFHLTRGILSSEDLFIASNAMNLSLIGQLDLKKDQIDAVLGVKPLGTVDKIVTNIPLAGWVLTGKEKALITAHFVIKGPTTNPDVVPVPISSLSKQVFGIFRRVLGLPGKVVEDVGGLLRGGD